MIHINLLPQEYRGRERVSVRVWATLLGAVVVVCCSLGFFGHVYLNELKTIEGERMGREERLKNLELQAKYDDDLVAEAQDYKKRATTIQDIANSRVLWTRLLDLFIDIVNNEGETSRHNVWFRNLSVDGGDAKRGPSWKLDAYSQTASFTKQANFLDDVENNKEFFADFMSINKPGGKVVTNNEKEPPQAVQFQLDLTMQPPSAWKRNRSTGTSK